MKVVFDATAFGSGLGGDETYLSGVLEGLAQVAPDDAEFPLLVRAGATLPESVVDDDRFPVSTVRRLPGMLHYTAALPVEIARRHRDADLVHSITHAPVLSAAPVALTVGDLSFVHRPDDYPRATRVRLQSMVRRQAKSARVVLAPSDFSRHDLIDTYDLDPDRVFTVNNRVTVPAELSESACQAAADWCAERGVRAPFVLYLGNVHPRKNVQRLIEAFGRAHRSGELAGHQLVIAGGSWFGTTLGQSEDWLVSLGRVDDDVRRWLLGEARALSYVSLFEGFGLPPIEAMALGTPVLASNVTAIPEVCADAAHYVDPTDVDAIAAGLDVVCNDDRVRAELLARGTVRAQHFDSASTGAMALRALGAACATKPARSAGFGQTITETPMQTHQ